MALKWFGGMIGAFALISILLVTSVEVVVYGDKGYFEREYTKYNVAEAVEMKMEDLLFVTNEMMDYLKDKREDLHITSLIEGKEQEFFNDREIAHMEDVKKLFIQAIWLRRIAVVIMFIVLICYVRKKQLPFFFKSFEIAALVGLFIAALLFLLASSDFEKYFTLFHKVFFNNDLWILNPKTDRLINIVPEPFFIDTATRICGLFVIMTVIFCFLFAWLIRRIQKTGV